MKKIFNLIFLVLATGVAITTANYNVFGRDHGRGEGGHREGHFEKGWPYPGRHFIIDHRGIRYIYHNGLFFRRNGIDFMIVAPPIGAVVPVLPYGYVTFYYGPGIAYYYMDGVYYRTVPEGYAVIPENEIEKYKQQKEVTKSTAPVTNVTGEEYIVNVPDSDGTFTPVKLKKSNNGYTGPQGEFYQGHPSIEQLKVLYGK
jgi:hypothetical protein